MDKKEWIQLILTGLYFTVVVSNTLIINRVLFSEILVLKEGLGWLIKIRWALFEFSITLFVLYIQCIPIIRWLILLGDEEESTTNKDTNKDTNIEP